MREDESRREARIRLWGILIAMDYHMNRMRDARLAWIERSIACGLDSTRGRTLTELANDEGVSKQAVSRQVTRFLRSSGLTPAFGLKSIAARQTYMRTNGRHDH